MLQSYNEFIRFFDQEYLEIDEIVIDIAKARITMVTYNLIVMNNHPNFQTLGESTKHILQFEGVSLSKREFGEYEDKISDSGLRTMQMFEDGPFTLNNQVKENYSLDCVLKHPRGWLKWDIEAAGFEVNVLR